MSVEKIIELSDEKYNFDIDIFEGPLDLLLHLARTQKIEISEISVDLLINQYILYIESVEGKGINVASEYIEMAAELIRLKSKMLLPNPKDDYLEELEEYGFTKEELIKKLIEYKKYKEISYSFNELIEEKKGYLYKEKEMMNTYRDDNLKDTMDIEILKQAIERTIIKQANKKDETRILEIKELEIEDCIEMFSSLKERTTFQRLVKNFDITDSLSTFLALLESMKMQYVTVEVDEYDVIIIPKERDE